MLTLFKRCLCVLLLILTAAMAFAASEGGQGETSQGSIELNLTIGQRVNLSNLQDMNFGSVDSDHLPAPISTPNVCVYSSTGQVSITATSNFGDDMGEHAGILENLSGQKGYVRLTMDGKDLFVPPGASLLQASTQSMDCSNNTGQYDLSAELVSISRIAGTYQGSITITIAPA